VTSAIASAIAAGYASQAAAVVLGSVVTLEGPGGAPQANPGADVKIPLAMFNRHGLVAGATGTGKTKTLQLIAEQLSAAGVPIVMPDIKGDLSGLGVAGEPSDRVTQRAADTADNWSPQAFPVEFLALAGQGTGVPIRATVDSFGPILLSKVLDLNDTQESTLGLIFHWSDQRNLPLLDLKDLRAVISHLTGDEGKADLKDLGGVSKSTAGVILRAVTNLEAQGGDQFFGETEFEITDLIRTIDGKGVVSLLESAALDTRPALFSTFLMWLLAELFEQLPEAGDLDKPKLVFLFDEAHLLFADASKAFHTAVAQTVKLIRSKGVGVFFCTQLPTDLPAPVLSQLGARIQHALRAFTPADEQALRATVKTYPFTDNYDLASALTSAGTGEAVVTVLSENGAPTPVAWTRVRAPRSLMAPAPEATRAAVLAASTLQPKYAQALDRDSAYERLTGRLAPPVGGPSTGQTAPPVGTSLPPVGTSFPPVGTTLPPLPDPVWPDQPPPLPPQGGILADLTGNPAVSSFFKSLGSALGGALGRTMSGTRSRRRRR